MRIREAVLAIICVFCASALGWASGLEQDFESQVAPGPRPHVRVVPAPPGCGAIDVDVWTDRTSYRNGDPVRIYVRTGKDAFVYVYSTDGHGTTRQLLPNYWDRGNFVQARRTMRLPDGSYDLLASGTGWDTIHVIAVSAESEWNPPKRCSSYSSSNPYPAWSNVESARAELRSGFPSDVRKPRGRVRPVERGGYGEAYTHIFVRPRVYSPPRPIVCPPRCARPCCRDSGIRINADAPVRYHHSYTETHSTTAGRNFWTYPSTTRVQISGGSFTRVEHSRGTITTRREVYGLNQSRSHRIEPHSFEARRIESRITRGRRR